MTLQEMAEHVQDLQALAMCIEYSENVPAPEAEARAKAMWSELIHYSFEWDSMAEEAENRKKRRRKDTLPF